MTRLIIFLIRRKLGLKKYEQFQFKNQKSTDVYFFTGDGLYKKYYVHRWGWLTKKSSVSFNWLLSDECQIKKVVEKEK